jgi:peroxiredoxin
MYPSNRARPLIHGVSLGFAPAVVAFCLLAPSSRATQVGDPAPPFQLSTLDGADGSRAPDVFWDNALTTLVFWNRGCPRCAEVVMAMPALADSLAPLQGRLIGVAFGPDEPSSLRQWLAEKRIAAPQLWDADGSIASLYGLGLRHLRVLLVDQDGLVRAVFEDDLPGLVESVLPAARRLRAQGASGPGSAAGPAGGLTPGAAANQPGHTLGATRAVDRAAARPAPGQNLRLDGRVRILSSQKVRAGDRGLMGEALENGSIFLFRYDLRYVWPLAPGLQFVPWLRLSNEEDDVLTRGAEQLSSPKGSASLIGRFRETTATLGAFPLQVSPLLLQRWDSEDAPPLGGVSTCGCGAGAGGLKQRSLEVLSPFYTFEGALAGQTLRLGSIQTWFSIPQWETAVPLGASSAEVATARYRRVLYGASADFGRTKERDRDSGLPAPVGLRLSMTALQDDGRTLPRTFVRPPRRYEWDWTMIGRVSPSPSVWLDYEYAAFNLKTISHLRPSRPDTTLKSDDLGTRVGLGANRRLGLLSLWARGHHLRTGPDFAPLYRALTYDPNRRGWRFAGGLGLRHRVTDKNEWVGASAFYRTVEEVRQTYSAGREKHTIGSITLFGRPAPDLLSEVHFVRTKTDPADPAYAFAEKETGASLDLRWERWPAVDPVLRLDFIRREAGGEKAHSYWQGYLAARVVI